MTNVLRVLLVVLFLGPFAQAEQLKLLVFKSPTCMPCIQFDRDYGSDPSFQNALKMFECVPAYVGGAARHRKDFERYGVSNIPVFIVTLQDGTEVGRVNGYTSKERLMAGLIQVSQRARTIRRQAEPRIEQRSTRPPIQQPQRPRQIPDNSEEVRKLRLQSKDMIQRIYNLEEEVIAEKKITHRIKDRLEKEATELRRRSVIPTQELDQAKNVIADLQKRLSERNVEPDEPLVFRAPETEEKPKRGLLKSVFHHGVGLAIDIGLSTAQAEVAVPAVTFGGPVGIGAVAGMWLFKRWRKRRGRSRGDPYQPPTSYSPPPVNDEPREITRYKQVTTDEEAKRIRRAMRIVSDRYPKTAGWTNLVEEAVELIKSGETQ